METRRSGHFYLGEKRTSVLWADTRGARLSRTSSDDRRRPLWTTLNAPGVVMTGPWPWTPPVTYTRPPGPTATGGSRNPWHGAASFRSLAPAWRSRGGSGNAPSSRPSSAARGPPRSGRRAPTSCPGARWRRRPRSASATANGAWRSPPRRSRSHGASRAPSRPASPCGRGAPLSGVPRDSSHCTRPCPCWMELRQRSNRRVPASHSASPCARRATPRCPWRAHGSDAQGANVRRHAAHRAGALRLAGGRPRRFAERGVDSLTPAQHRVTEMAAAGMTNKQIAASLFITLRTVETRLTEVCRSLGVDSRGALAGALESAQTSYGPERYSAAELRRSP
jgi:DNA-binding CsgD family transcriptional regulator